MSNIITKYDIPKNIEDKLKELNTNISSKVEKVNGLGLSQENFTTEIKSNINDMKTIIGDENSGLIKDNNKLIKSLHYVTPEVYGAVGDGVVDDTVAVQKAIDIMLQGGVTLYLKGKYLITSNIYFNYNKKGKIIGNVSANLDTSVDYAPTQYNLILDGGNFCLYNKDTLRGAACQTFENVGFYVKDDRFCVEVNSYRNSFVNCNFCGVGVGSGIDYKKHTVSDSWSGENKTIRCTFNGLVEGIEYEGISDSEIVGCLFTGTTTNSITGVTSGFLISECHDYTKQGMVFSNTYNTQIVNNYFDVGTYPMLTVGMGYGVDINGNRFFTKIRESTVFDDITGFIEINNSTNFSSVNGSAVRNNIVCKSYNVKNDNLYFIKVNATNWLSIDMSNNIPECCTALLYDPNHGAEAHKNLTGIIPVTITDGITTKVNNCCVSNGMGYIDVLISNLTSEQLSKNIFTLNLAPRQNFTLQVNVIHADGSNEKYCIVQSSKNVSLSSLGLSLSGSFDINITGQYLANYGYKIV